MQITISILTPFAAYLPADQLGVSGVLAVVTTGLYLGWRAAGNHRLAHASPGRPGLGDDRISPERDRVHSHRPAIAGSLARTRRTSRFPTPSLILDALLISALIIVVRFIWVFAATYLPRLLSAKNCCKRDPYPGWQARRDRRLDGNARRRFAGRCVGVAVADPQRPRPPGRDAIIDLIIFFTFVVILVTLVLQGLSLPVLIRWLKVMDTGETDREEREARLKANARPWRAWPN